MTRTWSLLLTLALLLAAPRIALAKNYDRRYHVGQGMAWAGLIALPVGGALIGYNEIPKSWNDHDAPLMAAIFVTAGTPLIMTIGDLTASNALTHIPGKRWSLHRAAGWMALGMVGGAVGLTGLAPGLNYYSR
jgi:hypothetical protein